jgi:hypothetical protein
VYKVVREVEGKMVSIFTTDEYRLTYEPGKTTTAKVGKIFVFSSMEHARNYLDNSFRLSGVTVKIIKGIATNPRRIRRIPGYKSDFQAFWESKKNKKRIEFVSKEINIGTIVCDSFKPDKSSIGAVKEYNRRWW